ncbi:MAG: DEAD/DEAH box helicase family protein [Erysipelotrichaceae bacterium]|nr:DEAD/DEAH box helicase family protein [Erysipelotrichaceae bacterium]
MENFYCPRCHNTKSEYFYKGAKGWYCRRCISFGRIMIEEENQQADLSPVNSGAEDYTLRFELSEKQKEISKKCAELSWNNSVLLHCVCGAGKTELVLESISLFLLHGRKVCFAIPRRQVVLELRERLAGYFPKARVIAVCGGHTDVLDGDLIICTTHQLYRYNKAFDLLILDEPDAFPFKGNEILKAIAENSFRQSMIYLTATPDDDLKAKAQNNQLQVLYLAKRPHGYPLCVPEVRYGSRLILFLYGLLWLKKQLSENKPVIWFVPSRKTGMITWFLLRPFVSACNLSSAMANKDEIISDFRNGKYRVCISTTVLERGVTIPRVNVLVYRADHRVFDEASLTQISGRVGRSFDCPQGECLFLAERKTEEMDKCIREIRKANDD